MIEDKIIAEKLGLERHSGYWGVNGKYFFNKAECLRYATSIKNDNISYHFFDSAFRSLDWTKEPKESLKEMYKTRAQQLRDKYDYLVLSFSGGSDSANILKTFIDNNIKLDEVYCEYPIEVVEKTIDTFTRDVNSAEQIIFEWVSAAKPMLESLSKTHPEIKITVVSSVHDIDDIILKGEVYKQDRCGLVINPGTRWSRLYETVRQRTIHGRVGCISGVDKPRIAFDPKFRRFYSTYPDTNNLTHLPHVAYLETKYDLFFDHFYMSYEYPQLNQKQCFVFKHAILDLFKKEDKTFYNSLLMLINPKGVHVFDTHNIFFKKLLYDSWDERIYQSGKSDNFFYPPTMKWYYDEISDKKRIQDYMDGQISELIADIDDSFIVKRNNRISNFKHYMTTPILF